MKHERVVDPVPGEPVVVPAVVRFNARFLPDGRIMSFDSEAARQAHIDCWVGWTLA